MKIAAVGSALPPNFYDQDELIGAFKRHWATRHFNLDRIEQLHRNVMVGGRHLALPLDEYERLTSWGRANDAWIRVSQEVGERAIREALHRAGLETDDIDCLMTVTVTGVATPSLDARLMNRLGLRPDVKRVPIFGLGCVAGVAGIARAADYVRGHPDEVVVLLSVELCSLTLQREDLSIPNLIASGLFGDGAAAAVVVGARRAAAGPVIVDSRSVFYPDSERVMGSDIGEGGFKIVLSADVPKVIERHLRSDVDKFLADHDLTRSDISFWVSHPGGPKVLEAVAAALELDGHELERAWTSLREVGNLSSTSVLMILQQTLEEESPPKGSFGVMLAMGPGFCSELILLEW